MRIVFVCAQDESLGVGYISSYLKKHGHQTFLVFDPRQFDRPHTQNRFLARIFNWENENLKRIIALKPDLIGFSVVTANYQWALRFSRKIKERLSTPIIFGGVHPTLVPERVIRNESVDMVCIGEGEEAMRELVNSLEKGEKNPSIKNIWFKDGNKIIRNPLRPLNQDLDRFPFADKGMFCEQLPANYRENSSFMVSRGCPFTCTFCGNEQMKKIYRGKGKYLRWRRPDKAIRELAHMKRTYGTKHVLFVDDILTVNKEWLKEFMPQYREKIGLPFTCFGHPQFLDQETVNLLKESGCKLIWFGIQSGSQALRRRVLNRAETNEQIIQAAQYCRKAKLKFMVDHIFNIPYEDEQSLLDSITLYNELRPDMINCYRLLYFPTARIVDIGQEAGLLSGEAVERINEGQAILYQTGTSTPEGMNLKDNYRKYALFLTLIPLLPSWFVKRIKNSKRLIAFFTRPPLIFIPLVKVLLNFRIGHGFIPLAVIKNELYFAKKLLIARIKKSF